MNRIVVKSKVGSDGILHLALPVGMGEADQEVQVTVESLGPSEPLTSEQWDAWVDWMAGSWRGDLQRPAPGEFEKREPLS
jgi:hypothetical protein